MKEAKLNISLLSWSNCPEELIYSAFRQCYSKGFAGDRYDKLSADYMEHIFRTNKANGEVLSVEEEYEERNYQQALEERRKLITEVLESGHQSPIEHVSFTFAIEGISRSTANQLVRHRLASYCVSKNTRIATSSSKTNNKTIEELYNLPLQYRAMLKLRCVNEETGELNYNYCKNIYKTGIQSVYRVTTAHGYTIDTTLQHKFLTILNDWVPLSQLSVGNYIHINGQHLYMNRDWLYQKYNVENLSQSEIGTLCGCSKHTIRKWIRYYKFQKPLGSWTIGVAPPNKGKTKYNYAPLMKTAIKMIGSKGHSLRNENNPGWKRDNVTISGGYTRTYRNYEKTGMCELCGTEDFPTEVHHIDKNPKNFHNSNLQELCTACHKMIHKGEYRQGVNISEIVSIVYIGEEETYDIEMMPPYHNFIANGFVVHNSQQSQRYCNGEDFAFVCPTHIAKNPKAKAIMEECFTNIQKSYKEIHEELTKAGHGKYANEEARCVLPQAAETKIVVTMNCRGLWNFFNERCCNRAQYEIRMMANEMLKQCRGVLPIIFDVAGAKCEALKYCPEAEKFCCGKYPTLNKIKTSEIEWSVFKTTWKTIEIAKAITSTIPNSITQIAKEIGNIKDKFKK